MDGQVGVEDGGEEGAEGGRGGGEGFRGRELLLLEKLVGIVVAGVEGEAQLLPLPSPFVLLGTCLLVCLSDACPSNF